MCLRTEQVYPIPVVSECSVRGLRIIAHRKAYERLREDFLECFGQLSSEFGEEIEKKKKYSSSQERDRQLLYIIPSPHHVSLGRAG